MNNEKLIELVRGYNFLYDFNDRRYSDSQLKDKAWKNIAKQLHFQEKYCKKSWASLRDAFRRAMKKQKETSGQANRCTRKWRYEDEMSFLWPFLRDRPAISSAAMHEYKGSGEGENSSSEENEEAIDSPDVKSPNSSLLKQEQVCEAVVAQPSTSKRRHSVLGPSKYNTSVLNQARIRRKTNPISTTETPSTTLMKFILENKAKTNDVQQFFDCIASTVQSFPPRDRAIAKAKVFEVISELEIEILSRDPSNSSEFVDSAASYETQNDFHKTECQDYL